MRGIRGRNREGSMKEVSLYRSGGIREQAGGKISGAARKGVAMGKGRARRELCWKAGQEAGGGWCGDLLGEIITYSQVQGTWLSLGGATRKPTEGREDHRRGRIWSPGPSRRSRLASVTPAPGPGPCQNLIPTRTRSPDSIIG
eukprot:766765-Hanusia_phi.AAC.8